MYKSFVTNTRIKIEQKVATVFVHSSNGTRVIALKLGELDLEVSQILLAKGQHYDKTGHVSISPATSAQAGGS